MQDKSQNRKLTLIPLLKHNPEYGRSAVEYVNANLEFSLNALENESLEGYEKSIVTSEVIRCMILSDVYTKELFFRGKTYSKEENVLIADKYVEQISNSLWRNKTDTFLKLSAYAVLVGEDKLILKGEEIEFDPPEVQVACLSDETTGLLGFIYTFLKTYDYEYENPYDYYTEIVSDKKEKFNVLGIYGIRSTTSAQNAGQKGIARSIIAGLAKYARSIRVPVIDVIMPPLIPMRNILLNLGFDTDFMATTEQIEVDENVTIIPMGCKEEILKPNSKWFRVDTTRRNYRLKCL